MAFLYDTGSDGTGSDIVKAPKPAKQSLALQKPSARLIAFVEGDDVTPLTDALPQWAVDILT